MPFDGLRVLSLESRRASEIERLIRAQGGVPFVAPSMREVPLENNPQAFAFAERLFRGEFDMVILLTGVGSRLLNQVIDRARVTVFHNGVLIQNNVEIYGLTYNDRPALYIAHSPQESLRLQDHGNPVRYRNIWIRRL